MPIATLRIAKWETSKRPCKGWDNPYNSFVCSECREVSPHKTNYCHKCGARMAITEEEDNR